MPAFKRISISGPNLFLEILKPNLGDLLPDTAVNNGFFGEFTVMDDVPDSKKIIDISRVRNILKRRDASCKIVFGKVGSAALRRISTTALYGATEFCREEFYQGCLKDWRNGDPTFIPKILDFFRSAVKEDMISLMYFGDTSRVDAANATWNTNKFDGVYTQYLKYVTDGTIPSGQTMNIPTGAISASNAKIYLQNMLDAQDAFMKLLLKSEKAFYIDQAWADAYEEYLLSTGQTNGEAVNFVQDGIKVRAYKGIPIFVNPIFEPVLNQISGDGSHLGILTIRGNFIFATDSQYGEGEDGKTAFKVWYDWDCLEWKWVIFLKAGTGIALPENTVLALPA